MDTRKLIPLVTAAVILVVGLGIYFFYKPQSKKFEYLLINYNNNEKKSNEVYVGEVYNFGNAKLYVSSVNDTHITFTSSETLLVNNNKSDIVDVELGDEVNVCIDKSNCMTISLK